MSSPDGIWFVPVTGINFRFLDDDELLETPTGAFVLEGTQFCD